MQTMPFVFLLSLDQISEQAFPAPFKYTLRGDSVCNLHMGVGFKSRKTMTHTRFGIGNLTQGWPDFELKDGKLT